MPLNPDPAYKQQTIGYKTYLKQSMKEAMQTTLQSHIDQDLKRTNILLAFPKEEVQYPCLIIKFYEKQIKNAGVAHAEQFKADDGHMHLWKHYFYEGDIEFAIYTLESLERDILSDALVEIITMGDLQDYTQHFLKRIYPDADTYPLENDRGTHYITIDTDTVRGFGENETPVKWESEDKFIYQTSYRASIFGEFYSLAGPRRYEIEHTPIYPWIEGLEDMPQGNPNDPAPWH